MGKMWTIAKRELHSYFVSPVAYIVMAVFLLFAGYFFWNTFLHRVAEVRYTIFNMAVTLVFLSPAIGMRLFAEEKKMGTIELLITSPVTTADIVIGKYLASALLFFVIFIITLQYPVWLFIAAQPETGIIISSYLGFLLLGLSFISVGAFASSLTENQIVAWVIGFSVLLTLWIIDWIGGLSGGLIGDIVSSISIFGHFDNFKKGVISASDVFYYISMVIIFLFLTIRRLEVKR